MKRLPQEQLPVDLSGFDLSAFATFLKKTAPAWVESCVDGSNTTA